MSELYKYRKAIAVGGLTILGGLSLAGCSEATDYAGTGNEYDVVGVVEHVQGDDTIQIYQDQIRVKQADGEAVNWFAHDPGDRTINFDPDYNKEGTWNCEDNNRVGHVYDANNNEIDPTQLQPGDVIEIIGSIRTSDMMEGKICDHKNKNVFDDVHVVSQPSLTPATSPAQ